MISSRLAVALVATTFTLAAAPSARADNAEAVVAAERAFAQHARDEGVNAAFRASIAPDGILFSPDPVPGLDQLAKGQNKKGPPFLDWWPVYAGIARSGDLGFTTGPFVFGEDKFFGFYFTIWRKQPDGTWKFILDHGANLDKKSPLTHAAPVTYLAPATGPDVAPTVAIEKVRALEAAIAAKAKSDTKAAYAPHLADNARLVGSGAEPVHGRDAALAELGRRPSTQMEFEPINAGASAAGDLVYSYGHARWSKDGKPLRGHYVRLWQQQGDTWKLVFDEWVPLRG